MARISTMSINVPGCELWIEYNSNNNQIHRVEWTIPSPGVVIRAQVWDGGQLVIDRTEGQGSGSMNIPGNYRAIEIDDGDGGVYMGLPTNLRYQFNMQTIG